MHIKPDRFAFAGRWCGTVLLEQKRTRWQTNLHRSKDNTSHSFTITRWWMAGHLRKRTWNGSFGRRIRRYTRWYWNWKKRDLSAGPPGRLDQSNFWLIPEIFRGYCPPGRNRSGRKTIGRSRRHVGWRFSLKRFCVGSDVCRCSDRPLFLSIRNFLLFKMPSRIDL